MRKNLLNPFERHSEKTLLMVGLIASVAGILLSSLFKVRFDGVIDIHVSKDLSLIQAAIDISINVATICLILFGAARIVNVKTRLIDILNATLISRIPPYLVALLNMGGGITEATQALLSAAKDPMHINMESIPGSALALIACFALAAILATIWSIALLYNGYKVAANAKTAKAIGLFIGAIILSEITTQVIFYLIK